MTTTLSLAEKKWLKYVFFFLLKHENPDANGWTTQDYLEYAKAQTPAGKIFIKTGSDTNAATAYKLAKEIMTYMSRKDYSTGRQFDNAIEDLSGITGYYDDQDSTVVQPVAAKVCTALAKMCSANDIKWDTAKYSSYEIKYFNQTKIGQALLTAGVTEEASSTINNSSTQTTSTPGSQSNNTQGNANSGPKLATQSLGKASVHARTVFQRVPGPAQNPYKYSGPRSYDAWDLKSTPGQKVQMTGEAGYVFCIMAEDSTTTANRPFAYVNPLLDTPRYRVGSTNKVKFDSAHGYSDLRLLFNTYAEADAFLQKMQQAGCIPSKLTAVQIGRMSLHSGRFVKEFVHGFYEIGTELGNAFVCAKKLNENL